MKKHTPKREIRIILSDSYLSGKINKTEFGYVNGSFHSMNCWRGNYVVRTDMICLYADKSLEENMGIIKKEQYTRFPVC